MESYWRRVASRAWAKALRTLGFTSRGRLVTTILAAITVAAVLLFWGSQDAAGDMALERGALWGLAILAFPFVYVWHFLRAPGEMDSEQTAKIAEISGNLEKAQVLLSEKQSRRKDVLTLSILAERGQDLAVTRIQEPEYAQWAENVMKWNILTMKFLATKFSHQDAMRFKVVRYNPNQTFTGLSP